MSKDVVLHIFRSELLYVLDSNASMIANMKNIPKNLTALCLMKRLTCILKSLGHRSRKMTIIIPEVVLEPIYQTNENVMHYIVPHLRNAKRQMFRFSVNYPIAEDDWDFC